jgi:hypothetical protein
MALRFGQLFSGGRMEWFNLTERPMRGVPALYEAHVRPSTALSASSDVRSLARLSPRSG